MRKLFIVFCLLFSAFLLTGCSLKLPIGRPKAKPGQPTPEPTKPLETTILERPFATVVPTADGHWVDLTVTNIKPTTKSIDYELIYFAGDIGNKIERGVAGSVELKGEKTISRKILFGSESCTVKCKYKFDENISEGTLTLKLKGDSGTEKYDSVFRLQKGSEAGEALSTGDGNFKFVSTGLTKNANFLTISTIGVPGQLPGKIAALPYAIFPSASGKGEVSFKTAEEAAKILLWDGTKWLELQGTLSNGWLTAQTSKAGIFALVK